MARASTSSAVEGALALAAAMGIGRFAYTALLPPTQVALGIGDDVAGGLASANLAGYLAGVLLARQVAARSLRTPLLRLGLLLTALAAGLGAATTSVAAWVVLRAAAGVASGLVFVLASAAALEASPGAVGTLYAGVGAGIALSGAVAALAPTAMGVGAPWLALGLAAAALALPAWRGLATAPPLPPADAAASAGHAPPEVALGPLAVAYFFEGLGYIVSGTFAVAAVRRTPGLEGLAAWTWVLTGLAAIPSALLWGVAGRRLGLRRGLVAAHLTQAVGMALPVLSHAPWAALLGAALFGSTFVGIVALAMAAGRRLAPSAPGRIVGTLTAVYGVGQIIGPIAAGALSERLGDPGPAVLAAAVAVGLGGLVVGWRGTPRGAGAPVAAE